MIHLRDGQTTLTLCGRKRAIAKHVDRWEDFVGLRDICRTCHDVAIDIRPVHLASRDRTACGAPGPGRNADAVVAAEIACPKCYKNAKVILGGDALDCDTFKVHYAPKGDRICGATSGSGSNHLDLVTCVDCRARDTVPIMLMPNESVLPIEQIAHAWRICKDCSQPLDACSKCQAEEVVRRVERLEACGIDRPLCGWCQVALVVAALLAIAGFLCW